MLQGRFSSSFGLLVHQQPLPIAVVWYAPLGLGCCTIIIPVAAVHAQMRVVLAQQGWLLHGQCEHSSNSSIPKLHKEPVMGFKERQAVHILQMPMHVHVTSALLH